MTARFRPNPDVEPADWPIRFTDKAPGDVVIDTYTHDRFCRCRGCKPPLRTGGLFA